MPAPAEKESKQADREEGILPMPAPDCGERMSKTYIICGILWYISATVYYITAAVTGEVAIYGSLGSMNMAIGAMWTVMGLTEGKKRHS